MQTYPSYLPDWFGRVSPTTVKADIFAAITGATVVLPQAIAFAAIAGLPPEFGIYTAMTIPIIAALFGSSWHLVSGPTTAISAVVFATLAVLYEPGSVNYIHAALVLTLLAGIVQVALALARVGEWIALVSRSVMIGFTAGAAILIIVSQIGGLTGVEVPRSVNPVSTLNNLANVIGDTNWRSLAIGVSTIVVALLCKKLMPLLPNYLIALVFSAGLAVLLNADVHGVTFIEPVAASLPPLSSPFPDLASLRDLTRGALVIALVGVLEALSIGKAIALKSRQDLDSNKEIMGQGLSNMFGSFMSSYVGSGSFTRSALNYETGARTPLAAILSSFMLFLLLLLTSDAIKYVPLPAMSGLILIVAWRLIDTAEIVEIAKTSRPELLVVLLTFSMALLIGLEFSIYSGVLISLLMFINRTLRPKLVINAPMQMKGNRTFASAEKFKLQQCPQLTISRINGPLYFGAVEALRQQFRKLEAKSPDQKNILIRIGGSTGMDLEGAHLIAEETRRRKYRGGKLYLTVKNPDLREVIARFKIVRILGSRRIFRHKKDALAAIVPTLDRSICETCKVRIFLECPKQSGSEGPTAS